MRTELRQCDQYALAILAKMKRRRGYVTWKSIHKQMVGLRYVLPKSRGSTLNALVKLLNRGAIERIICHSSDGRYAYRAK